jgi:hypothetical protein
MKNIFGMQLVICTEDFSAEIAYNNYRRVQDYKKGVTYACAKTVEYFNRECIDKVSMYEEKGTKGLCTLKKEIFDKYFVDVDSSIYEINNMFELIMDNI